MSRVVSIAYFGLFLPIIGCQMPAERLPLRQLPEDSQPLPYAELLTRARLQATNATEAFYVNQWADLEDAAKGLSQTARFMPKAIEVPAARKEALPADAKNLNEEADKLLEAVKARDINKTNEILQRIHLKVRQLRLDGAG